MERQNATTLHGNSFTVIGRELAAGDAAPDFTVLDSALAERSLRDYAGKIKVIAAVPSLDTPVCDLEIKRFNAEAAKLSNQVVMLSVSMDLPFALKRFCVAQGIEQVVTLSDHRAADFGTRYGVLIKELRLLSRAVFIVDAVDTVRYAQYVKEMSDAPDYAAALSCLRTLLG